MMKKSATAYKKGNGKMLSLNLRRACAGAAWVFGVAIYTFVGASAEPQQAPEAITCRNPYSGASWQIRIDYDRRTVDSNPAEIDGSTISWRDAANGWYYALDRKSGKLTVTMASSTGGNFLHDQCKLDH